MLHLIKHDLRDADPAGIRDPFQPGRDIYAGAEDVVTFAHDIAQIDANAKLNPTRHGDRSVAFSHPLLDVETAANCIDNAGELNEKTVASGLHDPAAMLRDDWINAVAKVRLHRVERAFLVLTHETGIARDVSGNDRCQPPLNACARHRLALSITCRASNYALIG